MNRTRRCRSAATLFLMTAAALIIGAPSARAQAPAAAPKKDATPAGNIENGKKIYTTYGCYECHGRVAQGGTGTGPRLGPRPIPYPAFAQYNRQPKGQMPPYTSKIVTDQELADIYAFLQSLPQPQDAKSIPLLNQ